MNRIVRIAPFILGVALFTAAAPVTAAPQTPVKKGSKTVIKTAAYTGAPVSDAVAAANKAELVARVKEVNSTDFWMSRVVNELMTFHLSEAAWKVMLSDKGVKAAFGAARDLNDYAVRVGLGDLEKLESANSNAREANQPDVTEQLAKLKPLIAIRLEATQPDVSPTAASLITRTFSTIPEHRDRGVWKPAGGKADITIIVSPVATDTTVTMDAAKTKFVVMSPSKSEIAGWSVKIEKGLDRGK